MARTGLPSGRLRLRVTADGRGAGCWNLCLEPWPQAPDGGPHGVQSGAAVSTEFTRETGRHPVREGWPSSAVWHVFNLSLPPPDFLNLEKYSGFLKKHIH